MGKFGASNCLLSLTIFMGGENDGFLVGINR